MWTLKAATWFQINPRSEPDSTWDMDLKVEDDRSEESEWSQRRELNPHLISKTRRPLYPLSYVGSEMPGYSTGRLTAISAEMEETWRTMVTSDGFICASVSRERSMLVRDLATFKSQC